jgi:hypothetical protein
MKTSVKKRLPIAILVPAVLILVAIGIVPLGTVVLSLDKDTYYPDDTVNITVRSLRIGTVEFGRGFRVQRCEDGGWIEVPLDRWWPMDIIGLRTGEVFAQSLIPAEDFVDPPEPGKYRVVKEIRAGLIRLETSTLIAEFHIKTQTSEQQGVEA